eukprot:CAMPEP_0177749278 /NCGR_PEP_ID=MMETSP0484_2-20121128/32399_1 /TAXON_ID=354590 /ORGANISM="Rhodomonas lens, Strain RHODO" /LENGTH=169 /DNA_ID=CAMNT_0019264247 /DNA_START=42 /DNA_END=548 /DNA_ORIENTATION=+
MTGAARLIPEVVADTQKFLDENAQEKTKSWWENYVKGSSFRGCNMAASRAAMQKAVAKHSVRTWSADDRVQLGMKLLEADPYTDDKLAGVLLLAEISLPAGDLDGKENWDRACEQWRGLFMANKISDWNICDWLCVKVLGPGAARNGRAGAGRLLAWSHLPPEQSTLWL